MEYGFVPKIDQYRDNKAIQLQQVSSASEASKLSEKKDLAQINKEEFLNASKTLESEKIKDSVSLPKYEYTLTNLNFGFNDESKDFYVKVKRGKVEDQYPTEQMMRLKAFLLHSNESA
ncbi:MAG: hypothetical protein KGV43_03570 [Arcobacter sp.]|nr:hypothetical protein [Arcobacter sp.]